jgi:hypothetical protein
MRAECGAEKRMNTSHSAWNWLGRELDRWHDSGQSAHFWWRDDDAVEPGAELERLLQLSESRASPLSLAVIPAGLKPQLADSLQDYPQVSVLQHGYSHQSHASPGTRKLELGGNRATALLLEDLQRGFQVMQQQLGARFTPVLVPPWNRIDERIVTCLVDLGFVGISNMRVRRKAFPAPGLLQVNTHLDPVNWRHRRGFIGLYPAIAILIQHLAARRSGYRDIAEPTGILSHHLVHNEAVWRFLGDLLDFLRDHPAVNWVDAPTIWNTSSALPPDPG